MREKKVQISKDAKTLKKELWNLWGELDEKILEKFKNINGKTGQYDVPFDLWQKRTSRSNRVLLRWKVLLNNKIEFEQLNTFFGGVCVEFVNDDIYNIENSKLDIYNSLVSHIGGDDFVSAMISFRNEDGDSGATSSRAGYELFLKEPEGKYTPIKRKKTKIKGKGDNSGWTGNLFYSIKGGSQISFESHSDIKPPMLFNPAVEYANELVCLDIDITMSYFALHCYDLGRDTKLLKKKAEDYLIKRVYLGEDLLSYCKNHFSLKWGDGILIDPIQLKKMSIEDFKSSGKEDSADVCHSEAANKNKFYFDRNQGFILSPARPNNFFWAKHLSNMMQQNYNLDEYFEEEGKRYLKRNKLI